MRNAVTIRGTLNGRRFVAYCSPLRLTVSSLSQKRSRSPYALGDTLWHNGAHINRITGGVVAQPPFPHCCPRMHASTYDTSMYTYTYTRARIEEIAPTCNDLPSCRLISQLRYRATSIIYVRARENYDVLSTVLHNFAALRD